MKTEPEVRMGRIPWASEAREEAWLEWAGQQSKEAINDALTRWEPNQVLTAVLHNDLSEVRFDFYEDDPAVQLIGKLSAAIAYLRALDPEDAIRVCEKMNLPGDWEYNDNWDPRSF